MNFNFGNEFGPPDFFNSSYTTEGVRSQTLYISDLISEGPIQGLAEGEASIYLNNIRIKPLSQSTQPTGGPKGEIGKINITGQNSGTILDEQFSLQNPGELAGKVYITLRNVVTIENVNFELVYDPGVSDTEQNSWAYYIARPRNPLNNYISPLSNSTAGIPLRVEIAAADQELVLGGEGDDTVALSGKYLEFYAVQDISQGFSNIDGEITAPGVLCLFPSGIDNSIFVGKTYTVEVDQSLEISGYSNPIEYEGKTQYLDLTFAGNGTTFTGEYFFTVSSPVQDGSNEDDLEFGQTVLETGAHYRNVSAQFRVGNKSQYPIETPTGLGRSSFTIALGENKLDQIPEDSTFGITHNKGYDVAEPNPQGVPVIIQGSNIVNSGNSSYRADDIDAVRVIFQYNSLINVNTTDGKESTNYATYHIDLILERPGTSLVENSPEPIIIGSNEINEIKHSGKTNSARSYEVVINLERYRPYTDFQIRIARTSPSVNGNSGANSLGNPLARYNSSLPDDQQPEAEYRGNSTAIISQVVGYVNERLTYPYCAYSGLTFSSEEFQRIPKRSYDCKGLLISVPSNYVTRDEAADGVAKYCRLPNGEIDPGGVTQDWTGDFREKVYCNNPAWVLYDLLLNKRYGVGDWISPDDIDEYALYRVAKYCDELVPDGKGGLEPRFTCNVYLKKATEVYKVIKDLASIFRGVIYWMDSSILPIMDQPGSAIANFTPANVLEGGFSYTSTGSKARANQIIVSYTNPASNYTLQPIIVEDTQNIIETGKVITEESIAYGATSEGQAQRHARWKLWTSKNQNEIVTFKTGIQGASLLIGDIINISDTNRYVKAGENRNFQPTRYAGRVITTTNDVDTIALDRSVELKPGYSYTLSLYLAAPGAYLAQTSGTYQGTPYSMGDLIPNISSEETASNAKDSVTNEPLQINWNPYSRVETKTVLHNQAVTEILDTIQIDTGPGGSYSVGSINQNTMWILNGFRNLGEPQNYDAGTLFCSTGQSARQNVVQGDSVTVTFTTAASDFDITRIALSGCTASPDTLTSSTSITLTLTNFTGTDYRVEYEGVDGNKAFITGAITLADSPSKISTSAKAYKVISLKEEAPNVYLVSAMEHYNEKFDAVDNNFNLFKETTEDPPEDTGSIVPPPKSVFTLNGINPFQNIGNAITIQWVPPGPVNNTNNLEYEYTGGYEVITDIPGYNDIPRIVKPRVTSLEIPQPPPGTYTIGVRTRSKLGGKSAYKFTKVTIEQPYPSTIDTFVGLVKGARSSTRLLLDPSTNSAFFNNDNYAITPLQLTVGRKVADAAANTALKSQIVDLYNDPYREATQDHLSSAEGEDGPNFLAQAENSAFLYYEPLKFGTDPYSLIRPNFSLFNNCPFWYRLGERGDGLPENSISANLTGQVQLEAETNILKGTGTLFTSQLKLGDTVVIGAIAGGKAAKVSYILNDTTVYIDRFFSDSVASADLRTIGFVPNYKRDCLLGRFYFSNRSRNFESYCVIDEGLNENLRTVNFRSNTLSLSFTNDNGSYTPREHPSQIGLTADAVGYTNPKFKIEGPGFTYMPNSNPDTEFQAASSGPTYFKILNSPFNYSSEGYEFTVTVSEAGAEDDERFQSTSTLTIAQASVIDGNDGVDGDDATSLQTAVDYIYWVGKDGNGDPIIYDPDLGQSPPGITSAQAANSYYDFSTGILTFQDPTLQANWSQESQAGGAGVFEQEWYIKFVVNQTNVTQTISYNTPILGASIQGLVTFNDLESSGSTTINGDNITTGTISADRILVDGETIDTDNNGRLIIKDLGVDTLKIKDQAVTVPLATVYPNYDGAFLRKILRFDQTWRFEDIVNYSPGGSIPSPEFSINWLEDQGQLPSKVLLSASFAFSPINVRIPNPPPRYLNSYFSLQLALARSSQLNGNVFTGVLATQSISPDQGNTVFSSVFATVDTFPANGIETYYLLARLKYDEGVTSGGVDYRLGLRHLELLGLRK